MTAGTRVATHARPERPSGRRVVGGLAVRQLRHGTVVVTAIAAGMSALVAAQYRSTFQGELGAQAVQALADNPAIRVLFGPAVALDDPGGFTVWRTGTPVLVLAGVWLLLAAVRVTRGEEDAGRWDLLLAGRADRVDVVSRYALAVAGAAVTVGAAVGIALVAAGTDVTGAVVYALGVAGVTATLGLVGLAAAQVMPNRWSAVGVAVGGLGAALLLRMLADGVHALGFVAWLSPFGLLGLAAPYAGDRLWPLAALAVHAGLAAGAAVAAARRRDLGAGLLSGRSHRRSRLRLLGSAEAFAFRRAVRPTMGWVAGVSAYFLVAGAMIASILDFFAGSPRFADLAAAAGFAGLDSASGFAAALLRLLAIATGLYAATRLASVTADERAGRATLIVAAPVSRSRLLAAELAVAAVGVLVLHVTAALAMWGGARLTGAPLGLGEALAGALNTAPAAWLALGAAALAVGWLPAAVTAIGAVPVAGGFLLEVVADSTGAPAWVAGMSPFRHMAATPAVPPAWAALAVCGGLGAVAVLAGVAGYRRRDLAT